MSDSRPARGSDRTEVGAPAPSSRTATFQPGTPTPGDGVLAHCHLPPELVKHPRYQVFELLGAGGMGCVYRARHLLMDRMVALKVINRGLLQWPTMVARFLEEVRAAARLSHPNIVRAYDAERVGDAHFLVMEYVDGVNLDQVLAGRGPLPVAEACDYARQAARGLQHAWQCGMVHRDIKPHNLMRTTDGQIKILDFGLARYASEIGASAGPVPPAEERLVGPGSTPPPVRSIHDGPTVLLPHDEDTPEGPHYYPAGTADYIAPEEVRDARKADTRADVYSLGCTLYRFLTGRVPFPEGTPVEKLRAHLEATPEPLARLRPELPADLVAVVERMMAKEVSRRYQTPGEVVQALGRFAGPARGRILVVDDDATVRQAMALALEGEGYAVAGAANGREALDRLRTSPHPDLILLDMMMPVMDGWQFLHELKRDPALAAVPVVVVSATGRAGSAALGALDFLEKPVAPGDLASAVQQYTRPH